MSDNNTGYEIAVEEVTGILRFRGWGFWDKRLAQNFKEEWMENIRKMSASGDVWYALFDLTDFPAQSKVVQEVTREVLKFEEHHGLKRKAYLVRQTITQMQIERLIGETELLQGHSFFQTEHAAIQWLVQ